MTAQMILLALACLVMPRATRFSGAMPCDDMSAQDDRRGSDDSDGWAFASTFDLMAVCLSAGMSVSAAAAAAAPSAPGQLGVMLQRASDLLTLGADPETCWSVDDSVSESCIALTRLARRSVSSGAALGQGLAELAEKTRQDIAHQATASAQRAGVLIAGPLGLCFLPAFVCVGIVPVVIGLAGEVLHVGPLT